MTDLKQVAQLIADIQLLDEALEGLNRVWGVSSGKNPLAKIVVNYVGNDNCEHDVTVPIEIEAVRDILVMQRVGKMLALKLTGLDV